MKEDIKHIMNRDSIDEEDLISKVVDHINEEDPLFAKSHLPHLKY